MLESACITKLNKLHLTVDILVNNAGKGNFGPFIELDPAVEATNCSECGHLTTLSKLFGADMVARKVVIF